MTNETRELTEMELDLIVAGYAEVQAEPVAN